MNKEYFNEHVLNCKECGHKPTLVKVSKSSSLFDLNENNNDVKFQVICEECRWIDGDFGNKTGLCNTPESALKIWNKKFGLKN